MKKLSRLVMVLLMGAVSLGFASCSDDDDDNSQLPSVGTATTTINANDLEMEKVAKTYVKDVVYSTYSALAVEAKTLNEKCEALYAAAKNGTLQQSDIDAACEAFKNARREWERSEAFLYGAASDNNIDPHIDSWPLDRQQMVDALNSAKLIAGIKGDDPAAFVYNENGEFDTVMGFHGLEFILFRDGANRTLAAINAGKETAEGMTSVNTLDELAFAAAISGDLRNMTSLLAYGWLGDGVSSDVKTTLDKAFYVVQNTPHMGVSGTGVCYGAFLLNKGYGNSWGNTINNIFVGGCSNICSEVATQKLGQAYRVAIGQGGADDAADYIESPYSKRSFIDYQDNIYSIKNSLYGTRDITATAPVANSIMKYLQTNNAELATKLDNALKAALNALETAKNSGIAFIDNPGHPQVKTAMDAVNDLDDVLNEAGTWFTKQADK